MLHHMGNEMRHKLPLLLFSLLIAGFLPKSPGARPAQLAGWETLSANELSMKEYAPYPGADAVVLLREEFIDDVRSISTCHRRVKILTEEGKKFANIEIPYDSQSMKIEELRARTVRPDGTSIEFAGKVYERILMKKRGRPLAAKTFALSEASIGSVIEYAYKVQWLTSQFPARSIILQDEIPMQYMLLTRRSAERMLEQLHGIRGARLSYTTFGPPPGTQPEQSPDGTVQYILRKIPPFIKEEYSPPANELIMRIDFNYRNPSTIGPLQDFTKQLYATSEKFIEKSAEVKRLVKAICQPADSSEQKLRKLYARAQQIHNLDMERPLSEQEQLRKKTVENHSVQDVIRNGYGTGLDINLFFMAMARAAGFRAALVCLSGRDKYLSTPRGEETARFDSFIIAVTLKEEIYLDPATSLCPYALLSWEQTGVEGRRIDSGAGSVVKIPPPKSDESIIDRKAALRLLEDGSVEGKLELSYSGQFSLAHRLDAIGEDDDGRRKQIEDEIRSWLPPGAKVEIDSIDPWTSHQNPLRVVCRITLPHVATITGRRALVPASLFHFSRRHPFQSATRVHPVYFNFPYQENDDVTLEIPAAYQLESLPGPSRETGEAIDYQAAFEQNGNSLHFQRRFTLNKIYFKNNSYPTLRKSFDKVRASDEQQVVLQTTASGK
jgi:hypothetical protein